MDLTSGFLEDCCAAMWPDDMGLTSAVEGGRFSGEFFVLFSTVFLSPTRWVVN